MGRIYPTLKNLKIQDAHLNPGGIHNQIAYRKYSNYYYDYKSGNFGAIPDHVLQRIQEEAKEAIDWLAYQKQRFANIEFIYDQLCLEHTNIEIIYQ